MSRRVALLALLPVLLLAGCAAAPASTHSSASPTVTPDAAGSAYGKVDTSMSSDAPTAAATDTRPWASLISEQEAVYAKWRTPWDRDSCSALSLDTMPCGVEILTGGITAETISLSMSSAVKSTATGYIADAPPPELASVWDATKAAADAASTDGQAWSSKCAGKTSDACASRAATLTEDLDNLQTAFAGWAPYGA